VPANFFIIDGATVTNTADGVTVKAVFPATEKGSDLIPILAVIVIIITVAAAACFFLFRKK
jgi:hypothetical protein